MSPAALDSQGPHADGGVAFTFLGTGTSVGVPMIACDCPVCLSNDARDKRDRCSLFVKTSQVALVVDTGPDFRHQCLRAGIRHLDAVLITHAHTDHIMGFDDLRRFTFGEEATLPVFATAPTLAALARSFSFAFDGQNRHRGYFKPDPRPVSGAFTLGDLQILPLPVIHGNVDTVGFLFSHAGRPLLAYLSDVKQIPRETMAAIHGVDTLVVDCIRHQPLPTHFNVAEALHAITEVAPQRTFLTHLSHELGHAAFEATLPPEIRVAYDGLVLHFPYPPDTSLL